MNQSTWVNLPFVCMKSRLMGYILGIIFHFNHLKHSLKNICLSISCTKDKLLWTEEGSACGQCRGDGFVKRFRSQSSIGMEWNECSILSDIGDMWLSCTGGSTQKQKTRSPIFPIHMECVCIFHLLLRSATLSSYGTLSSQQPLPQHCMNCWTEAKEWRGGFLNLE